MNENEPENGQKRQYLPASPAVKKRLKALSKKEMLPLGVTHQVILEWALPHFETGEIKITATPATQEEVAS